MAFNSPRTRFLGYGPLCRFVKALASLMVFSVVVAAGSVPLAHAGSGVKILVLGDSLTAGYGLPQSDAFPVRLQAALRARGVDVTIINAGVSGDTSAGGRARLDWLLAHDVDGVIIELGANDALRGLDPMQTRKNLEWIIARLRAKNISILLSGMLAPPNLGQDYARSFKALYFDLAKKYGTLFYPFFLDGVAAVPALNQADGIHPNAAGVAVIVKRITAQVMKLVARVHTRQRNHNRR